MLETSRSRQVQESSKEQRLLSLSGGPAESPGSTPEKFISPASRRALELVQSKIKTLKSYADSMPGLSTAADSVLRTPEMIRRDEEQKMNILRELKVSDTDRFQEAMKDILQQNFTYIRDVAQASNPNLALLTETAKYMQAMRNIAVPVTDVEPEAEQQLQTNRRLHQQFLSDNFAARTPDGKPADTDYARFLSEKDPTERKSKGAALIRKINERTSELLGNAHAGDKEKINGIMYQTRVQWSNSVEQISELTREINQLQQLRQDIVKQGALDQPLLPATVTNELPANMIDAFEHLANGIRANDPKVFHEGLTQLKTGVAANGKRMEEYVDVINEKLAADVALANFRVGTDNGELRLVVTAEPMEKKKFDQTPDKDMHKLWLARALATYLEDRAAAGPPKKRLSTPPTMQDDPTIPKSTPEEQEAMNVREQQILTKIAQIEEKLNYYLGIASGSRNAARRVEHKIAGLRWDRARLLDELYRMGSSYGRELPKGGYITVDDAFHQTELGQKALRERAKFAGRWAEIDAQQKEREQHRGIAFQTPSWYRGVSADMQTDPGQIERAVYSGKMNQYPHRSGIYHADGSPIEDLPARMSSLSDWRKNVTVRAAPTYLSAATGNAYPSWAKDTIVKAAYDTPRAQAILSDFKSLETDYADLNRRMPYARPAIYALHKYHYWCGTNMEKILTSSRPEAYLNRLRNGYAGLMRLANKSFYDANKDKINDITRKGKYEERLLTYLISLSNVPTSRVPATHRPKTSVAAAPKSAPAISVSPLTTEPAAAAVTSKPAEATPAKPAEAGGMDKEKLAQMLEQTNATMEKLNQKIEAMQKEVDGYKEEIARLKKST